MFGAIGAYDGRPANIGRVVVSSTFHHFVDINLIGDPWAIGPDGQIDIDRRKGYLASESGQSHLADIEAHFVAIALWLSRP
jgi:hypothetical protein